MCAFNIYTSENISLFHFILEHSAARQSVSSDLIYTVPSSSTASI